MNVRVVLTACWVMFACNAPSNDLFAPVGESGPTQASGGSSAGSAQGMAGSGATPAGGSAAAAGENTGAKPSGGSAGSGGGSAPEGGADGDPPDGMAGADQGMAGMPDPPAEPVCGNGKLEAGEECDDAGHAGKDGCSAQCQVVCSDHGEDTVESDDHHCYNGYDSLDFEGAAADCVERGAHLVSISSKAENDLASTLVNQSKYIGASEAVPLMDGSAGTYKWLDGSALTYSNWAEEEPDRSGERCEEFGSANPRCYAHCAIMTGNGTWVDQRCDMNDGYICEWEPAGQ